MEFKANGTDYSYSTFFILPKSYGILNMKKAIIKTNILHHKHFRLYFSNTVSYFRKKALIKNKVKYVSILSSEWTIFSHCLIFSRAAAIDACFFKLCPRETG